MVGGRRGVRSVAALSGVALLLGGCRAMATVAEQSSTSGHRSAVSPSTAAGAAAAAGDAAGSSPCPLAASAVSAAFGGEWTISGTATGCAFRQGARTITVGWVAAPAGAAARAAALDQVRRPCDAGSVQSVPAPAEAFVCTQASVIAGSALRGHQLLCVFTTVGTDADLAAATRSDLISLLSGL